MRSSGDKAASYCTLIQDQVFYGNLISRPRLYLFALWLAPGIPLKSMPLAQHVVLVMKTPHSALLVPTGMPTIERDPKGDACDNYTSDVGGSLLEVPLSIGQL